MLTDKRLSLTDKQRLMAALCAHIGKDRGITVEQLARILYGPDATTGDQRTIRNLVEELRREGQHICANPAHGYYIARNEDELNATCLFLYRRAMTSLTQIAAMKRVSMPDIAGQLRIRLEEKPE